MKIPFFNALNINAYCPNCEYDSAINHQRILNLPNVGKILKINTFCSSCNYNVSDFIPFNVRKSSVVKFRIRDKLDLDAKVIKSQSCVFRIPELGVEVGPGPESHAEIINVAGLLSTITLALDYEYGSNKLSRAIQQIKAGKKKVTIVLEDPLGVSRIIPRK